MTDPAGLDDRRRAMLDAMGLRWPAIVARHAGPRPGAPVMGEHAQTVAPFSIADAPQFSGSSARFDTNSASAVAARLPAVQAGPESAVPGDPASRPSPPGDAAQPAAEPAAATAGAADAQLRQSDIARMGWDELKAAVAGCRACRLCESRRNTVFGVGDPGARWLVVGEAPGEQEDLQGEPFVGPAGRLLDQMLAALGLARGRGVYIANVLKCRPPGNRNPDPAEVARCEPFLRRQIALIQPAIVLAMGRFAVQSLLGSSEPIGRLRGRVHTAFGPPIVVTYHPAYLLRNLPDKAKAWADLCLARDWMARHAADRRPGAAPAHPD